MSDVADLQPFSKRPKRYIQHFAALLLGLFATTGELRADYKLGPGDQVGLTVIGFPDLNSTATVDAEGHVVLPLIGNIKIGGLSIPEATAVVQAEVPKKELNRHLDDGRTMPVILATSQVSLSLASYRPIYLSGNVAKPGEQLFRPGLTVRQAIALAGGLDLARLKADNPLMQIADFKAEYEALAVDYLIGLATTARLEAELAGKSDFDFKAPDGLQIPRDTIERIAATERRQLKLRLQDGQKEKTFLNSAAQKETRRGQTLEEQRTQELDGLRLDTERVERYEELLKKGQITLPAISEARRSVLQSSTRALQTAIASGQVEREKDDLGRRLERYNDQRQMLVLKELQDATSKLAGTKARLQAISAKLRYVGALKPRTARGLSDEVQITITRFENGRSRQIAAVPDMQLQPGDVAEIALQADETIN